MFFSFFLGGREVPVRCLGDLGMFPLLLGLCAKQHLKRSFSETLWRSLYRRLHTLIFYLNNGRNLVPYSPFAIILFSPLPRSTGLSFRKVLLYSNFLQLSDFCQISLALSNFRGMRLLCSLVKCSGWALIFIVLVLLFAFFSQTQTL